MVARMTRPVLLAALACGMSAAAQAQPLADPTRPPAAMLAAPAAAASAPADALQLQSVLLGKGRAPAAVISGQLVVLGGKLRDAVLVRVTERSATLKGPQGLTTLSLLPSPNSPAHSPEPTR